MKNFNIVDKKLFVSTACIPDNNNFIEVIDRYIKAGITNIEIGSSHLFYEKDQVEKLFNYHCNFLLHNYFPPKEKPFVLNLASEDTTIKRMSFNLVKEAIDLSAKLGSPFFSFHAGFIKDPIGFGGTSFLFPPIKLIDDEKKAFDRFLKDVEILANYASNFGLKLLIENNVCTEELRGKLLLQSPKEFLNLFDALSNRNLGILVDTGHLKVSSQTQNFDLYDFFFDLKEKIMAFHIHDNDGFTDQHNPVQQGSWIIEIINSFSFFKLPIVIESKFNNITEIQTNVNRLNQIIG